MHGRGSKFIATIIVFLSHSEIKYVSAFYFSLCFHASMLNTSAASYDIAGFGNSYMVRVSTATEYICPISPPLNSKFNFA